MDILLELGCNAHGQQELRYTNPQKVENVHIIAGPTLDWGTHPHKKTNISNVDFDPKTSVFQVYIGSVLGKG